MIKLSYVLVTNTVITYNICHSEHYNMMREDKTSFFLISIKGNIHKLSATAAVSFRILVYKLQAWPTQNPSKETSKLQDALSSTFLRAASAMPCGNPFRQTCDIVIDIFDCVTLQRDDNLLLVTISSFFEQDLEDLALDVVSKLGSRITPGLIRFDLI